MIISVHDSYHSIEMNMGPLEDLFQTRTMGNHYGTVLHNSLLLSDLDRLEEQGVVERIACPFEVLEDSRERTCFLDLMSGDVYVYIAGWERGSPEFRKFER